MAYLDGTYERYRAVRFFGSLNGLRFLCIVMVMWHHSPARVAMEDPARLWLRGFTGVDFFFVLSGFLITTLLLREEEAAGRISLPKFYRRRILRIVPVYFFVVTAVAIYYVFWKGRDDLLPLVPYYYLFLSNFLLEDIPLLTITWSLSVEEQYYLLWPLMLVLLPALLRVRAALLTILIAVCVTSAMGGLEWLGLHPVQTDHALWRLPVASYAAILIGSFLAVMLHSPKGFALAYVLLGGRWSPVAAFTSLVLALSLTPVNLLGLPFFVVHLTMAACLATLVLREDHVLGSVMAWRPAARIGEISYGIYLYHLIGLHIANVLVNQLTLPDPWARWVVTFLFPLVSIAIAEISYRTLERFFLSLKGQEVIKPYRRSVYPHSDRR